MSDQRQSLAWMKWRDQLKISLAAITTQKSPIITFHLPWSWFHVLFLWLFSTLIRIGTKWDDDASRPSFSLVLRCRLRGMRLSARANADAAFVSDNKRRDLCAETHNTSANGIKTAMFLNWPLARPSKRSRSSFLLNSAIYSIQLDRVIEIEEWDHINPTFLTDFSN